MNDQTVDLFSGTGSFSKVAAARGYRTLTLDFDKQHAPDICSSILDPSVPYQLPYRPAILWASPPCTTFSVASISTHWTGGINAYIPKSAAAKVGLAICEKTVQIIAESEAEKYFVENPRGVMRKVIDQFFEKYGLTPVRHTVTYCQYGDSRMKPTDIWTNVENWTPRPVCKNGDICHESAPRGSKTGTQGLKGAVLRSVIPPKIMTEIFNAIETKGE